MTRHLCLSLAAAVLALGPSAPAAEDGPAHLVANINQTIDPSEGSDAFGFTQAGRYVFFLADDGAHPNGLWRTDGTAEGTILLADLSVPGGPAWPSDPVAVGDKVVLWTRDAVWLSDGTPAGTVTVHDHGAYGFAVVGHVAYFFDDDALWQVDADTARSRRLFELPSGVDSGGQLPLTALGDVLLFSACSSDAGCELWRSDGTAAGTARVRDIAPGPASGLVDYDYRPGSAVLDGALYFVAEDGESGAELWRSDGTAEGTRRVRDINPGPGAAFLVPYDHFSGYWPQFTVAGDALYFVASDGRRGFELWRSDGTAAGTRQVADGAAGAAGLFDCAVDHPECEPRRSTSDFAAVGDTLFFTVRLPAADEYGEQPRIQLWRSDGTAAGTAMIEADVDSAIAARGDRAYFVRRDPDQQTTRLWSRTADASQSTAVAEIPNYTSLRLGAPLGLVLVNDEPWWSDGTAAGTHPLKDIRGDDANAYPAPLGAIGSAVLLAADDGIHGRELWRSEGSAGGTTLVADIAPGAAGSDPTLAFPFAGGLLFLADDGVHGRELWRSDGTAAGTALVADINPGGADGDAYGFGQLGSRVVFFADDGVHGRELWITDGTAAGTHMVRDVRPGAEPGAPGYNAFWAPGPPLLGDAVFFAATDGVHGLELWRSDGTEAGTAMVVDLQPGAADTYVGGLAVFDGHLFFNTAPEPRPGGGETVPLWRSDGTAAGTVRVTDLPSAYDQFLVVGGSAFFNAWDGHGEGLWRLDDAASMPVKVDDQAPYQLLDAGGALLGLRDGGEVWRFGYGGLEGFREATLAAFGRRTVLLASDWDHQTLWTTGGTAETTLELQRLAPPRDYIDYACEWPQFTRAGDLVYFAADGGDVGCELWAVPVDALAEVCVDDCPLPPTATPTPGPDTPVPTPACGSPDDRSACTQIVAGEVSGTRGETVSVDVRLVSQLVPLAGVQNDLLFDRDTAVAATGDGRPVCAVNAQIDKPATAFAFEPPDCRPGRDCTAVRAIVLALDNVDPIADGSLLYTCQVAIGRRAAIGRHRLAVVNVGASDTTGTAVAALGGDGTVSVLDSGISRSEAASGQGCQVAAPAGSASGLAIGAVALLAGLWRRRR